MTHVYIIYIYIYIYVYMYICMYRTMIGQGIQESEEGIACMLGSALSDITWPMQGSVK